MIGIEPIGVNRRGVAPINSAEHWRASAHYDQRGANSKILASAVSVRVCDSSAEAGRQQRPMPQIWILSADRGRRRER